MRERVNKIIAWVQHEMIRGRLTAVQAETLTKMVKELEAPMIAADVLGPEMVASLAEVMEQLGQ